MPDPTPDCDHEQARVEYSNATSTGEMEIWIACPECHAFWDTVVDLDNEAVTVESVPEAGNV